MVGCGTVEVGNPGEVVMLGLVGADGRLCNSEPADAARGGGWSVVSVNSEGSRRLAIYGPYPDRCTTTHRAEVWGG